MQAGFAGLGRATRIHGFGAPAQGEPSLDQRLAARERRSKTSSAAAKGLLSTAATVAAMAPPWSTIGAGVLAGVGASLLVANGLRRKGDQALRGEQQAIAAFLRRSARWSAAKRERMAVKLHRELQAVQAAKKGQQQRRKKGARNRTLVREAKLKLKIAALVALEIGAHKAPHERLIADDPATVPAQTAADPTANTDSPDDDSDPPEFALLDMDQQVAGVPLPFLAAGGLLVGGLALAWFLNQRGQAPAVERRRRAA